MGEHFALTFKLPQYQRQRQQSKKRAFALGAGLNIDISRLGVAVFASIILLFLIYFFQVNSFATKGFEIKNLQQKIELLKESQKQLQVQAAELQSFQRIQGDPTLLNMVPVSNISYIQTTSLTQR